MKRVIQAGPLHNLSARIPQDERGVRQFFSRFGHVIKVQLWYSAKGKRHAFVTFSTESEAKDAILAFSSHGSSAARAEAPGLLVIEPQRNCKLRYEAPYGTNSHSSISPNSRYESGPKPGRRNQSTASEESVSTSADNLLAEVGAGLAAPNISRKPPPPLRLPSSLPPKPTPSDYLPTPSSPRNPSHGDRSPKLIIPAQDSFSGQSLRSSTAGAAPASTPHPTPTSTKPNGPSPSASAKQHDEFMSKLLASHAEQHRKIEALKQELSELRKSNDRNFAPRMRALDFETASSEPAPDTSETLSSNAESRPIPRKRPTAWGDARPSSPETEPERNAKRRKLDNSYGPQDTQGTPESLIPSLKSAESSYDVLKAQLEEATRNKQELADLLQTVREAKDSLWREMEKLQEWFQAERSKNEELQHELDSRHARFMDLSDTMNETNASLERARTVIAGLEQRLATESTDRKTAEEKAYAHDAKTVNLEAEIGKLSSSVADLEGRLKYATGVIKSLQADLARMTAQKAEAESALTQEKIRSSSLEKALGNAGSIVSRLEAKLAQTQSERDFAQEKVDVLLKELKSPVAALLLEALLITDKMLKREPDDQNPGPDVFGKTS